MILATEEEITATLKVISANTKGILANEEVITGKLCQPLQSDLGH